MEISFEVNDSRLGKLAPTIAAKLRTDPDSANALAEFALSEMLEWMSGETTYQSLTQQYTDWVTELLPRFFEDRPPTPNQIYNAFSVPYGRAAYISRVLVEKEQSVWRLRGRQYLLAALRAVAGDAATNVANGEPDRGLGLHLEAVAYRELTVLLDELYELDPLAIPASRRPSIPGRFLVELPSEHVQKLIERLA